MKKTITLTALFLLVAGGLAAQELDSIMQPLHIVGKAFDSEGQTVTYLADFEYQEDGKLEHFIFDIPDLPEENDRDIYYTYSGGFMDYQGITQQSPGSVRVWKESYFQYNDQGRLLGFKSYTYHVDDLWSQNGYYVNYRYGPSGRIVRKELGLWIDEFPEDYTTYWVYEYGDGGKNVTTTMYDREWHNNEWCSYVNTITTTLYSDEYLKLSVQVDTYNRDGEITRSKLQTFAYNEQGLLESETSQYLIDGEWVNSSSTLYGYDGEGRCIETVTKTWSDETNDWTPTKKTLYEYENENTLLVVSFWKYEEGLWTHDTYQSQPLLLGDDMKRQEECINDMTYKHLGSHSPKINYYQFEITLDRTKRPIYMSAEENKGLECAVFPNPGKGNVTVKAPVENAVVRFYDLQGRLVTAKPFDFNTSVTTDGWSQGVYLWEIWIGTQRQASGKWVKE